MTVSAREAYQIWKRDFRRGRLLGDYSDFNATFRDMAYRSGLIPLPQGWKLPLWSMLGGPLGGGGIGGVLGQGRGSAGNGLLTGLVGYWGLDEASGDAIDAHSGGLTLTQAGTVGTNTGIVYSAARTFPGTASNYFSRASDAATVTGNVPFVLAGWVYITSTAGIYDYTIASKFKTSTNSREYQIYWSRADNRFSFAVSSDGTFTTGFKNVLAHSFGAPSLNTWYLIIGQHDASGDTLSISVNNGTVDSTAHSAGVYVGSAEFCIGAIANPYHFATGRIGPVAFWKNRTLSAADRSALWNGGAGLAYSAFTG
jgi:hypothetical protein